MRVFLAAVAVLATGMTACTPPSQAPAVASAQRQATHPISGLPVIDLTATTARGPHTIRVEVASRPEEQEKGLMFRTQLGADEGMLFVRNPPGPAAFWMKNTPLPLDIIFIGTDRRVINVAASTVPYSLDPVEAQGTTAAVLELNAGRAAQLGIGPGTPIAW